MQKMNCIMIQNKNPNTNPKNKHDYHDTSQATCLATHQPNYYSNLHVMLYFVEYNNVIPFCKQQSCQANKVLIDC